LGCDPPSASSPARRRDRWTVLKERAEMRKRDRHPRRRLAPLFLGAVLPLGAARASAQPLLPPSPAIARLHQAPSVFRDPENGWAPPPELVSGRFGLQNAFEARWLVGSANADGDLEPERLGAKMLLALPLLGRDNLGELLLEPRAHLVVDLAERGLFHLRHRRLRRLRLPPGAIAIDTHVHTCFSHDS